MAKKHPIVLEIAGARSSATNFDLVTERWKPGFLFCLQRVSFRIATSNPTKVDIGVRRAGKNFWLETFKTVVYDDVYQYEEEIWVPSDYEVIVRVIGGTTGALCEAWVYGYIQEE